MTIYIKHASTIDSQLVAQQVINLLAELDSLEITSFDLEHYTQVTKKLMSEGKILALLAYKDDEVIGVLTLNSCCAIYNGGEFGEICELYVKSEFRSAKVGKLLIDEAVKIAQQKGWGRIEVGAPSYAEWSRTIAFYKGYGFEEIGPRLGLKV